jgi:DNA (cytosine-5)-methyltransferase 1
MTTAQIQKKTTSLRKKTEPKEKNALKFMDFCAGIGGGRLGLQNLGMECVAFSEIDKKAEKTYRLFFGEDEKNYGDLMKINVNELPDFDVMIAGFPCQTFSVVGQRKGMSDARGQVIYGLIKILKGKNIKYFILENVKGLVNHDKGNSLKVILKELDDAGYNVSHKVLNSVNYNTPQHRERIYFVGVRKDIPVQDFEFPEPKATPAIKNYLIDTDSQYIFDENEKTFSTFKKYLSNKYNKGLFELEKLLKNDFEVIDTRQSDLRIYKDRTPTLRTGRHGILYVKNKKLRKLSGYESLLLQGFPEHYARIAKGVVQDTNLLAQTGNAMTVSTIEEVGRQLLKHIKNTYEK